MRSLVNRLAFHPQTTPPEIPHVATSRVQEIELKAADGTKLQAFFIGNKLSDKALLFFHGNAGNAYQRISDAIRVSECGCNVLLLSYRGYGKSEGAPSEDGVYQDAQAALHHLRAKLGYPIDRIFVLGRSIGSAVAIDLAGKLEDERAATGEPGLAGLILVTPLSSGRDMASALGLGWIAWLAGRPFDSHSKAGDIDCPVLFIHGDKDSVIPISLGKKLYAEFKGPRSFEIVVGADHNDIVPIAGENYWRWIREFLSKSRPSAPARQAP